MKKFVILLIVYAVSAYSLLLIATINSKPVFAQDIEGVGKKLIKEVEQMEKRATKAGAIEEKQMEKLKEKANLMIEKRITELNKVLTRIQSDKRLTDGEKTLLSTDIQNTIINLNNLKDKINADTDLATLRADVKKIVTDYRILTVLTPKTRLLVAIAQLQNLTNKIQQLTPQIQTLINNLKSQGKDVASLQSLLDDINSRLSAISTKLTADKSIIMNTTIANSDYKTNFVQVRKDLAFVRSEFAKIRADFAQMRNTFKISIKSSTATPSAK